jgi:hypothetical protein
MLLGGAFAVAQQQQGAIFGTVTDETGAVVPGATVEISGPSLIGTQTAITNDEGTYRFPALPPGTYSIRVTMPGFGAWNQSGTTLNVGRTLKIDVRMKVADIAESVEVSASVAIDVVKSESAQVYNTEEIEFIPRGRDYSTIAQVTPGINVEKTGINVDGASGSENVYVVDGIDSTDMYSGTTRQQVPFEFIEEIQIKSAGYEAEYGGAMGGVVSVVTKSGSNAFSGEATYYLYTDNLLGASRDRLRINPSDNLTAEYIAGEPNDNYTRHEIGVGVGGPIIKDRLWFYGSYLPVMYKRDRTVTFLSDDSTQTFYQDADTHNASVKVSTQFMDKMFLSGSYNLNWYKTVGQTPGRDGTDNPDDNWAEKGSKEPAYTLSANMDYLVSPTFVVAAKGGMFHSDNIQLGGPDSHRWRMVGNNSQFDPPSDLVRPSGWSNISSGYVRQKSIRDRQNFNTDSSFFFNAGGEHNFKVGYQFNRIHNDVDNAYANDYMMFYWGYTYYSSFNDACADGCKGQYGYLRLVAGPENPFGEKADVHSNRHAFFIQDSWRPTRNLSLNLGLRFEKEDIPSFSDLPEYQGTAIDFGFGDKIAPRVGVSYDVFGDSRFKIFGSWGKFYDVMKLELANGSFGGFKWIDRYYTLETLDWQSMGGGNYTPNGGQFLEEINWRIPSFDTLDPDLDAMRMAETIVGAEYGFGNDWVFSGRYVHKHIERAIEDVGVATPGGEKYYITNPGYGYSVSKLLENGFPATPKAKRSYNAMELIMSKRFSQNWRLRGSYTYSQLRGLYSGLASSDEEGRQSPNVDRDFDLWFLSLDSNMNTIDGPLQTDRPHQFKLDGNYNFPFGLNLGVFQRIMSGRPITRTADINHVDVIVDNRASDGRMPVFTQTDVYLAYNFNFSEDKTIQVNFNIENLFNQKETVDIHRQMIRQSLALDIQPGVPYDYKSEIADKAANDPYFEDARFGMANGFQSQIEARFGLKFLF